MALFALFIPLFTILCFATLFVCVLHYKVKNKQISHRQNNSKIQTNNRRTFKTDTTNTNIYDYSILWLETGTSIKTGRVNLGIWAQTSLFEHVLLVISVLLLRHGFHPCGKVTF
jgi:hypothetical protein